jgi:hypothetical protein
MFVDTHLEEPLRGAEEFDIEAIADRIFKLLFDPACGLVESVARQ